MSHMPEIRIVREEYLTKKENLIRQAIQVKITRSMTSMLKQMPLEMMRMMWLIFITNYYFVSFF
ncbi:hypothetical protein HS088_TW01G00531 [Tripterygium wilfordii]|uniref:Uncharacterized protein n=1 Tax=Tripterygium wilfordii TaxID=458696 RepID=A0A7J7E2T0_TRIWF|nr:hypothetical protein HS088_TW01G00531 [Tripterygium wilfordii]